MMRLRGTADIPLSREGKAQLAAEAADIGQRGGFDVILSSPLYRARQTAKAFLNASGPNARMAILPGLLPQRQGELEGRPKAENQALLDEYQAKRPDEPLPGVSPYTGKPGQSFNSIRTTFLRDGLIPGMQMAKDNPDLRVLALTHSSNIKIAHGWDLAGRPQDLSVAPSGLHEQSEVPGGILRVDERGFSPLAQGPIQPGFYLGRHGQTTFGG